MWNSGEKKHLRFARQKKIYSNSRVIRKKNSERNKNHVVIDICTFDLDILTKLFLE